MIKRLPKIGYYFLIIVILFIGGLLMFSMVPIEGNFQAKIVLSGSMEPAIKVGSVAIVKPVSVYEIGDVVTFGKDDRKNIPITHRIVDISIVDGQTQFTTKGDANDDPDPNDITEDKIIGKVLFSIPYLGFIIDLARKPWGFAVLIGIPALVIVSDEVAKIWRELKKMGRKKDDTGLT